jgi:hypothetical protein
LTDLDFNQEREKIEKQKTSRKSKIRVIATIIFLPIIIPIWIIGWTLTQRSELKQGIKTTHYKEHNYASKKTQEKQITILEKSKIENEPIPA